jgi:Tfp pilus assembly protein FimT
LRRNADVEVHPLVCERLVESDHDWSCGWQVFIDRNGNRAFDVDTDVSVGHVRPPYVSDISSTRPSLRFSSLGTTSFVQTFQINRREAVKVAWARIQRERIR